MKKNFGFGLVIIIMSSLFIGNKESIFAGTGKSLSWCSYLDKNNHHINRMRCIYTNGISNTYCFNYILWQNGVKAKLDCEMWLRNDISGQDKKRLNYILGRWNEKSETIPTILKNKITEEIVIIHDNETSYELQKCEKQGFLGAAGTIEPADICWLGKIARRQL